ncbi:putative transcriptional regulator [Gordonia neofelifaecis NRRL B-59395]|uniref:Putative transcriptional regulator n=1 Tax=Gordonia neofelifaecis NRRL B-59395 TaxID=644548 RepID=F1YP98_9ACTN|nr:putative transcriptional regulator [Gordonia neofelifaecis NRRL B-59395]
MAAILDRVGSRVGAMAQEITAAEAAQFLPDEMHDSELVSIGNRVIPIALRYLRTGGTPTDDELQAVRERAEQRAREGVPLSLVLGLWQRGFQLVFDECLRASEGTGDGPALGWIGAVGFRVQEVFVAELVRAYQRERAVQSDELTGGPQFVGRLLLLGHDPRADAERLDVRLDLAYHVLAVRLEKTPGELSAERAARDVAGRRKLHRVQRLFRADGGPAMLSMLDRDGGTVLIPVALYPVDDDDERLRRLVAAIAAAAGAPASAAVVEGVARGEIKDAAVEAQEVLRVAVALGRPAGLHRLADVAVAYQLSRRGPGAQRLSETIRPLLDQPDLLRTLRAYLDCDLDRLRAARALDVHPNTVNNRLNRIEGLCGTSPFRTEGIVALYAAVTAHAVEGG